MAEISRVITESPDIQDVYAHFAELVRPILPFDRIDITSIDSDKGTLRAEFVHGVELDAESARRGYVRPIPGSITEEIVDRGSGILFSPGSDADIAEEFPSHVAMHRLGVRSAMTAPLVSGGKVIGTLALMSLEPDAYTEEHLKMAERVALQISGAVANASLLAKHREIENALRSREQRFWEMYEEAPIAYTSTDADGLIVGANKRAREMFGYTSEEIMGRHGQVLLADTPSGISLAPELTLRLLAGEEVRAVELEFKRANGTSFWGSVSASIVKGPNGEVAAYRSTIQDISSQRRAEDALKRSEANYRTLIETMDAVVSLKDASGKYLVVHEAFSAVVGLPQNQIIGKIASEIFDDSALVSVSGLHDAEVIESRGPMRFERTDGESNITDIHKVPVFDGDGNVIGIVSVVFDVTQLHAAEEELRRVHEMYRLLVDSLEDILALKDASGRFLIVNQAFADAAGLPKEEIEGRVREEFLSDPELVEFARQRHEEVVRTGKRTEVETSIDHGSGPQIFHGRATPILDSEGRVDHVVNISTDITERKRLESELRQSQKMQVVGQLAGGVAHDFNNLLTAIAAYAAMAERKLSPDHVVAPFQRGILDAVDRASALIRQLLLFSRRDTASLEVVDVNDLILSSAEMLRRMIGTNIELVTTPFSERLPIEVDPSQFEQVLVNLAVNARDAMPDGGKLTVAVSQVAIEDFADDPLLLPGDYANLSVSDDGTGMAAEVRDRVFEPFFTTKDTGKGSGLGLSTCYGIVKENGGDIRVETVPGEGTTFDVFLPITSKPAPAPDVISETSEPPAGKETILLAEDESVVRDIVVTALREQGYTVVEASNGEEALRAAEAHDGEIHMLLTDMVMPRMGGKELLKQVQERWPGTPALLMSGYTGEEHMSGATPLLNKPFVIVDLLIMVRQTLDQRGPVTSGPVQQLGLWPAAEQ